MSDDPILDAVWRVGDERFDLDAFLARFPRVRPDERWRRGEPDRRGRTQETSGFNVSVARGNDSDELTSALRLAVARLRPALAALREEGMESTVDVGVFANIDRQISVSVRFSPEDLRVFAELGIELEVSAYPVMDEKEPPGDVRPSL